MTDKSKSVVKQLLTISGAILVIVVPMLWKSQADFVDKVYAKTESLEVRKADRTEVELIHDDIKELHRDIKILLRRK